MEPVLSSRSKVFHSGSTIFTFKINTLFHCLCAASFLSFAHLEAQYNNKLDDGVCSSSKPLNESTRVKNTLTGVLLCVRIVEANERWKDISIKSTFKFLTILECSSVLNVPTTDSLGFFCSSDSRLTSFSVVVFSWIRRILWFVYFDIID